MLFQHMADRIVFASWRMWKRCILLVLVHLIVLIGVACVRVCRFHSGDPNRILLG